MNKFLLIPIFIFILIQGSLAQQRVISGLKIEKKTIWSGTIIIEGDVTVTKKGRLIIDAGTNVLFKANMDNQHSGRDKTRSELIVLGILVVKGNLDNKVTFSSASNEPRMGDWYGISLMNPQKTSVIENCIVQYAFNGISIKKSNPVIRNSQMTLNYNAGILVELKAEPKITKNIISENGYAGVITRLGAKPILSDNLIVANEIGIIAFSLSQPNLGNLNDSKRNNQGRNNIFENSEYDVYNHTTLPLLAENNSWGNNSRRNEIASRVYDSADESKYGIIDFLPIYNKSLNLDEFLSISQVTTDQVIDSTLTDSINTTNPVLANNLLAENTVNTPPGTQPIPPGFSNELASSQEEEPKKLEQKEVVEKTKVDNSKVLAVNNSKPIKKPKQKKPKLEIDPKKIFLEYFINAKKAELVKKVAPKITRLGPKGRIIVRAVVGKDGDVESAAVIKGLNPYYDKLSSEAALEFKYKPGFIKNTPVRFYTNILFEF
jgi:parallel beta-helix repeat protein